MRPSVAVLGAGAMGELLAGGLLRAGWEPSDLSLAVRRQARVDELRERLGVEATMDASAAAAGSDVVVIAVKPHDVVALLDTVGGSIVSPQVVISFAAGVATQSIERRLGEVAVVRAMPNTPAQVDLAVTAMCFGTHCDDPAREAAEAVLTAVGKTVVLDESLLDPVTAVSGTGPAYVFLLAEALTDAAIREGLPRHAAEFLVDETLRGAGALLADLDVSPSKLRAQVTSPGGTTAAAMHVLEERGFRALVEDAVRAAAVRSREMGAAAAGAAE